MKTTLWLARDRLDTTGQYVFSKVKPKLERAEVYWDADGPFCEIRDFENLFPKHFHLPLGGGPIKITVEVVE